MSLAASQRRDQRRRLVLSWNRSSAGSAAPSPEAPRSADYSPEALPEHQPSLATLIPTGLGGFSLAAVGLLAIFALAVGLGVWEAATGGQPLELAAAAAPRFAASISALRTCLDIRSLLSVGGWLAQTCLVVAATTATIVRLMRRHRRDDYRGRYRAWGWLAGLFTITAFAGQVPLGPLVAAVMSDLTGIAPGPDGIGWWMLAAGLLYGVVGLWAVLPLHERAATASWLSLCLASWAISAACDWLGGGREMQRAVGNASWIAGATFAAIAMLAAARSVLREVRGLPARPAARRPQKPTDHPADLRPQARGRSPVAAVADDGMAGQAGEDEAESLERSAGRTEFVDGEQSDDDGERPQRHLSKAERKRLKKLARMDRAA